MNYKEIIEDNRSTLSSAVIDLSSCLGKNVEGRKIKTYLPSLCETLIDVTNLIAENDNKEKNLKYKIKNILFNLEEKENKALTDNIVKMCNKYEIKKGLKCSKCQCRNCILKCNFNSCLDCDDSFIKYCDKSRFCILVPNEYKKVNLFNNNRYKNETYSILCYIKDLKNQDGYIYIYMRNIENNEDEQIIKYIKFLNGTEDYKTISQEEIDIIYDMCLDNNII